MDEFRKKYLFVCCLHITVFTVLPLLAWLGFTECNMPMGMGASIDTIAPTIIITKPSNGQFITGVVQGNPTYFAGTWQDNIGSISELSFRETYTNTDLSISNVNLNYTIFDNGTWEASMILTESKIYRISITAVDNFRNAGRDEVIFGIDIIPPWIEDVWVLRSASASTTVKSELRDINYYDSIKYNIGRKPYKNIKYANIDDFQNDTFTLSVKIDSSISGIAASRLNIYDINENRLNQTPLIPDMASTVYQPEWTISSNMLNQFNTQYSEGPHYIWFEVMAWSNAAWDPGANNNQGGPRPDEPYLTDNIKGICWYPESNQPVISVPANSQNTGSITIDQGADIIIDFFDDDIITEIRTGLIKKDVFENLMNTAGLTSEEEYLESLLTNAARRNDLINSGLLSDNRFVPGSSPDNRSQSTKITEERGEYRLVALAKDSNTWGGYQPLKVNIINPQSPVIIVNNPISENTFPVLNLNNIGATKFVISGYTIDMYGTNYVIIAWVPDGARASLGIEPVVAATNAITTAAADTGWKFGESRTLNNSIKLWKILPDASVPITFGSVQYKQNNFKQTFDILGDFKYNGLVENKNKVFVIGTSNGSELEIKPFILTGYNENPVINVNYPVYDGQVHSKEQDLVLEMSVSPASNNGINIKPGTMVIRDVTQGNADGKAGFEGEPLVSNNNMKQKVSKDFILNNNALGFRTYSFKAEDILGNVTTVTRSVAISDIPALQHVTALNAPGNTYGIGTVLNFEAVFTTPVLVIRGTSLTAWPRLKLYSEEPGSASVAAKYAEFISGGPASKTMLFRYTVQAGDNITKLYTSGNPIDKNGAKIISTEETAEDAKIELAIVNDNNSLQGRNIGIDGVKPIITGVSFVQPSTGSEPYYNQGKTFLLELTVSKPIRVSGNPSAGINVGTSAVAQAAFTSINQEGKKIYFSYMVPNTLNDIETQVSWAAPWITFPANSSIIDYAGNSIDLSQRPDNLTGSPGSQAFIITKTPVTPVLTLSETSAGAAILGDIKTGKNIFVKIEAQVNKEVFISLEDGNNPISLGWVTTQPYTKTYTIVEKDDNDPKKSDYEPSEYKVTAWQADKAGNRSSNTMSRKVEYNARAVELNEISCAQPNGSYRSGEVLDFRLIFSRPVKANTANAKATLFMHDGNLNSNQISDVNKISAETASISTTTASSILTLKFTIPVNIKLENLKAYQITFSGVIDEFGNSLKDYYGTGVENEDRRPVTNTSVFNLNRADLKIDSMSPYFISFNPAKPGNTDTNHNGGLITNNKITLTFNKNISAQSGGQIIIRPYGEWAVPPVLTVTQFNEVNNATFYNVNDPFGNTTVNDRTVYQKRLSWVDDNGLPMYTAVSGTDAARQAVMLKERDEVNFYTFTTRGIVSINNQARPDTTGLYVLAFRHDLYEGVGLLREVFNSARWNWVTIPSTNTSQVSVNGSTVTITLPNTLPPGRIWEVIINKGAFRDIAGNDSVELIPGDYRFWSGGTEKPVIRVDRYSHGDNYHGIFGTRINAFSDGETNRPKIDTRVRIDCETPGASITYDTIRTSFSPAAAGTTDSSSTVFTTTTLTTGVQFFNHPNINLDGTYPRCVTECNGNNHSCNRTPILGSANTTNYLNAGYGNNWIGNSGSHGNGTSETATLPISRDAGSFFEGLLVPNNISGISTSTDAAYNANNGLVLAANQNGAILYTELTAKNGTVKTYRDSIPSPADDKYFNYGNAVFQGKTETGTTNPGDALEGNGYFFYVGDAYWTGTALGQVQTGGQLQDRDSYGVTDSRLYSGRRDYIIAAAKKNEVYTGPYSGPDLAASIKDYEGVYKTTVLHRNPTNASKNRLMLQGFDKPVNTTIPGFPLNEKTTGAPPFNPTEDSKKLEYLTRNMWRINATADTANNHFIWVSWDIVCDWYQKGRIDSSSLNRAGKNYSAILCTYGAVSYRYQQRYWDSTQNGTTR